MKTKIFFSAIFLIAMILGGCDKSSDVLQEDDYSTLKKKPKERPFRITGVNVGTVGFGKCAPDPTLLLKGEGHAIHMGRITISGWHCFHDDAFQCVSGPLDFTAANGDEVHTICGMDEEGNIVPVCLVDGVGKGTGKIIGGTGRFEQATGIINWYIRQNPDNVEIEGEGYIVY